MARKKEVAQTGCWSNSTRSIDQRHPGAHLEMGHPSSAEEGTFIFPYAID